jgi:hypothetical protein
MFPLKAPRYCMMLIFRASVDALETFRKLSLQNNYVVAEVFPLYGQLFIILMVHSTFFLFEGITSHLLHSVNMCT